MRVEHTHKDALPNMLLASNRGMVASEDTRTFLDRPDGRQRMYPQLLATAEELALNFSSWRCNLAGNHWSSSSRKAVHLPRQSRRPAFRAPAPPSAV